MKPLLRTAAAASAIALDLAASAAAQDGGSPPPAPEQQPPAAPAGPTAPDQRALYRNGHDGRYLLDGQWLFRQDHEDTGLRSGFARQQSTQGWTPLEIPHAWNAG